MSIKDKVIELLEPLADASRETIAITLRDYDEVKSIGPIADALHRALDQTTALETIAQSIDDVYLNGVQGHKDTVDRIRQETKEELESQRNNHARVVTGERDMFDALKKAKFEVETERDAWHKRFDDRCEELMALTNANADLSAKLNAANLALNASQQALIDAQEAIAALRAQLPAVEV